MRRKLKPLIDFRRRVITGFNTDIKHNEKVYHVQTEDKGVGNPYIESLVYVGGEILASKKTSYAEQLEERQSTRSGSAV